jgi:hypothetical protein
MPDGPFGFAIAALSSERAVAVGAIADPYAHPTAAIFDGTAWTEQKLPDPGYPSGWLGAVDVLSSGEIWAVGSNGTSTFSSVPLAEHWNGSAWTPSIPPAPSVDDTSLAAVDARTSGDVWAVGELFRNQTPTKIPLVEHWNGTRWRRIESPAADGPFVGVTAPAHNDVWAVTSDTIWHWDGAVWTSDPVAGTGVVLTSMASTSSSDVWAAGWSSSAGSLTLHWDGASWTNVPVPDIGTTIGRIDAIAARKPGDAFAVGSRGRYYYTFVVHWNGTEWKTRKTPTDGLRSADLRSASFVGKGRTFWAMGPYTVERFC